MLFVALSACRRPIALSIYKLLCSFCIQDRFVILYFNLGTISIYGICSPICIQELELFPPTRHATLLYAKFGALSENKTSCPLHTRALVLSIYQTYSFNLYSDEMNFCTQHLEFFPFLCIRDTFCFCIPDEFLFLSYSFCIQVLMLFQCFAWPVPLFLILFSKTGAFSATRVFF